LELKKEDKILFLSLCWIQAALLTIYGISMLPERFHVVWIAFQLWSFIVSPTIFLYATRKEEIKK